MNPPQLVLPPVPPLALASVVPPVVLVVVVAESELLPCVVELVVEAVSPVVPPVSVSEDVVVPFEPLDSAGSSDLLPQARVEHSKRVMGASRFMAGILRARED
jgi:hypothetical protein